MDGDAVGELQLNYKMRSLKYSSVHLAFTNIQFERAEEIGLFFLSFLDLEEYLTKFDLQNIREMKQIYLTPCKIICVRN